MLKELATILAVAFVMAPGAMAQDASDKPAADNASDDSPSWIMDTSGVGKDTNGVVRSDQILELGTAPSNGLQLEGENLMRGGDLDGALTLLQKAVEMSPMDMEKRILYSTALEKKLMKETTKDPALYNFLVKQWLFIYKKAEFVDESMQAQAHLVHLCGTLPKKFERLPNFLARVLIPEDGTAKVALTKKTAHTNGGEL